MKKFIGLLISQPWIQIPVLLLIFHMQICFVLLELDAGYHIFEKKREWTGKSQCHLVQSIMTLKTVPYWLLVFLIACFGSPSPSTDLVQCSMLAVDWYLCGCKPPLVSDRVRMFFLCFVVVKCHICSCC